MSVAAAPEPAHLHLEVAAFDTQRLAVEQGIGHLFSGGTQYPMEGRAGYVHPLGTVLLFQPL
jgi:hypothetical protein